MEMTDGKLQQINESLYAVLNIKTTSNTVGRFDNVLLIFFSHIINLSLSIKVEKREAGSEKPQGTQRKKIKRQSNNLQCVKCLKVTISYSERFFYAALGASNSGTAMTMTVFQMEIHI